MNQCTHSPLYFAGALALALLSPGCGDEDAGGQPVPYIQPDTCTYVAPAGAAVPSGSSCSPWTQDCGTDQGCYREAGPGFECLLAGRRTCDEACVDNNDCRPGLECFAGACRPVCEVGSDCGSGQACVAADPDATVGHCVATGGCDPAQSDCPPGQGCYAFADGMLCATPTGNATVDQPCTSVTECMAGLKCVSLGHADAVCAPLCSADGSLACTSGTCVNEGQDFGGCVSSCDRAAQNCPPGQGCAPSPVGTPHCVEGFGSVGDACVDTIDCATGTACLGARCTEACDPSGVDSCAAARCHAWNGFQSAGIDGFCLDDCDVRSPACPSQWGCYLDFSGDYCAPPANFPPNPEGAACAFLNDCAAGLQCVHGRCHRTCTSDGALSCGSDICNPNYGDRGWCATACDLIAQDCSAGFGCYAESLASPPGTIVELCYGEGSVTADNECAYPSDCIGGTICTGGPDTFYCRTVCGTDGSLTCTTGTCSAMTGLEPVGVCMP